MPAMSGRHNRNPRLADVPMLLPLPKLLLRDKPMRVPVQLANVE